MRILQICPKPPSPNQDGGCIAMYNIALGFLEQNCDLHILSITTKKHPFLKSIYSTEFLEKSKFETVSVNTNIKWYKALLNTFSSNPYITERFKSKVFERKLIEILIKNEYDIIQLESIFTCNYIDLIKKYSTAKIVIRSHNVEHQIIRQQAENSKGFKSLFLQAMASKLKAFEIEINKKVDVICAISDSDRNIFLKNSKNTIIYTLPFSVICKNFEVKPFPNFHLYHIGSMNWKPNIEGINWFLNSVWTKISNSHPSLQLHIAGRGMSSEFKKSHHRNTVIVGEVPSAKEFAGQHGILIVPLLTGSGMRVKIIESMAMGKAIISTTKGAEGINYTDGQNIILANTPLQFYEAVSRLVYTPNLIETISKNARLLIESEYDNSLISKKLVDFYNTL